MDSLPRNTVPILRILSDRTAVNGSVLGKRQTNTEACLLDNQASDADDEAESIYSDSGNSNVAESTILNQNDRELHQIIDKVTLGKQDRDEAASNKNENHCVPAWESDREWLIARLPRPSQGLPFRAPVAVMYLMDENGEYAPNDDTSPKRHKSGGELQIISDEEYVKLAQSVVKGNVKGGLMGENEASKGDSDASLGSPAVIVKDESSDSDGFTKVEEHLVIS
ncbi:MAG: hypothetical protein M1813_005472 [Trichoglossum hirsutum]|jgi:hypothetical protein|nr:MAG: hypothetical protein M1813_005472 [Trichoglossum hirsutum]